MQCGDSLVHCGLTAMRDLKVAENKIVIGETRSRHDRQLKIALSSGRYPFDRPQSIPTKQTQVLQQ